MNTSAHRNGRARGPRFPGRAWMLTLEECGERLGCASDTVRYACERGYLRSFVAARASGSYERQAARYVYSVDLVRFVEWLLGKDPIHEREKRLTRVRLHVCRQATRDSEQGRAGRSLERYGARVDERGGESGGPERRADIERGAGAPPHLGTLLVTD